MTPVSKAIVGATGPCMQVWKTAVVGAIALLLGAGMARAAPESIPGPSTDIYAGTREYYWTFYVPVVTLERRQIVVQGPNVIVRSHRFDYEAPGFKLERRRLGEVPEFYCKYPDLSLPNECGIVWRKVYADFPQLTMRRNHIDADVAELTTGEYRMGIDVPHWTWTARTLRVFVPVFGTEPLPQEREWSQSDGSMLADASVDRARATLDANRAASLKSIDDALARLSASISAIEAQGGDATKVASDDGSQLDLYAARKALDSEKSTELARYARIRAELDTAGEAGSAGERR